MTQVLTAEKVDTIMKTCLFTDEEAQGVTSEFGADPNIAYASGIVRSFGFNKERLEAHREKIEELLGELDPTFRQLEGGGWSFLNMTMDRHGNQWGEQMSAESLLCLGIALGKMEYCIPREMWEAFPGGVPYVMIKDLAHE